MRKYLSTGGIYVGAGICFALITSCFLFVIFKNTANVTVRKAAILFSLMILLLIVTVMLLIRRKLMKFSDSLNASIDDILNGRNAIELDLESETLTGKFNHKLHRLCDIMENDRKQVQEEKQAIQEVVSDISHQVKIPLTNLKMYNSTILEQQLTGEKGQEFNRLMETQIDKLNFLLQSMVKMSRLETGIISISASVAPIYDTIALALSGIELSAEEKQINVSVNCAPDLLVCHDKKWTAEALFNILDNGVKYTPLEGEITVTAERWEMVTKIDISDTGRGIPEEHYAQIFKRFYREEEVHDIRGAGIGLYLCRDIIFRQGGYVQVKSQVGKGSTFSVFLPNEKQL